MSNIIGEKIMRNVIVIGGGPAGMMASIISARAGNNVTLIEKNEKLGKKLYITGKGRCNLSNYCDKMEFQNFIVRNGKFVFGAINAMSPKDTYDFFEDLGLNLKIERGNRFFPLSDKASDVTKTLEKALKNFCVNVKLNEKVEKITKLYDEKFNVLTSVDSYSCDSVIVCTGGISYPTTGSDGDGYKFAKSFSHSITDLRPSLVGINLVGGDYCELQGVSLKNVAIKFTCGDKKCYEDFGEMLFTHFGVSGPIILSCSAVVNRLDLSNCRLEIDLKPALTVEQLDARLIREFSLASSKQIGAIMHELVPKSMIKLILSRSNVRADVRCSDVTKRQRTDIVKTLKCFDFSVKSLRPIEEAIVTSGGVNVKEINPKTMESKLMKGLYFAGEVIDIDAFTGGFNIQLALSTGYLAGMNA